MNTFFSFTIILFAVISGLCGFPMLSEATEYAISQKGAKVHDGVHCRWWSSTGNGESGQIGAWVFGAKESETTVLSSGITYASTDEFLYPSSLAGIRPAVWVKLD